MSDVDRRRGVHGRAQDLPVDRGDGLGVAFFQAPKRLVPADVTVQGAAGFIAGEPILDEPLAVPAGAGLYEVMDVRMCAVGVLAAQRERALGEAAAGVENAGFGMRPAEVREEPPVLAVVPRHPAAEGEPGRVVVRAPAESVQAEGAQSEREGERVARMRLEMPEQRLERSYRLPVEGEPEDPDMRLLALRNSRHELPCPRQRFPRFRNPTVNLQMPGETCVGEREARIVADGLAKARIGAGPRGKQKIHAGAVGLSGLGRGRGERKAVAVDVHHIHFIGLQA